jgi:signal transduction histidine kinase
MSLQPGPDPRVGRAHALSPRRLSGRIALLALAAALAPLLAVAGVAIVGARRSALGHAAEVGHQLAQLGAEQVREILARHRRLLASIAVSAAATPAFEPKLLRRQLREQQLLLRELGAFEIVGLDGRLLVHSHSEGEAHFSIPPTLLGAGGKGTAAIGTPYPGAGLEPEVLLAEPIRFEGRVRGVLVASVRLTETWAAIAMIRVGKEGKARLLGPDGFEVGHGDAREQAALLERARFSTNRLTAITGPTIHRNSAGREILSVAAPVPELGWTVVLEQPTDEAFALARVITWLLLSLVALVALVAGSVALYVARRTMAPVQVFAEHARQIPTHLAAGRAPPPLAAADTEELAAVGESLNAMGAELTRLFDEVRDAERLSTVARVGAGLAHDLRTPLVTLGGIARLLANRPDEEQARQLSAELDRELARTHRFVERMESLSRTVRHDAATIPRVPVDLVAAARRTAERLRAGGLVPRSVELVVTLPETAAWLHGNPDDLERLIENLLTNAFQSMADRSGQVWISVEAQGNQATLAVKDQGKGIEPERIPRLFREFASTRRGGFGIGLPSVRLISEETGGELRVESRLGEGTQFLVLWRLEARPTDQATSLTLDLPLR